MARVRWFSWASLVLVIVGGAGGVALRAVLTLPLSNAGHALIVPAVTMAINVLGSLVLGLVVGWAADRHPHLRTLLGTGAMGGFTTYSAFAVQSVQTSTMAPFVGVALMGVSLFGGLVAAAIGLLIGRRLAGVPGEVEAPEDAE